jgi:hypothetical protein
MLLQLYLLLQALMLFASMLLPLSVSDTHAVESGLLLNVVLLLFWPYCCWRPCIMMLQHEVLAVPCPSLPLEEDFFRHGEM